MWPTIFEFSWDTGHMVFFGVFYAVIIILATSIMYAVTKSVIDIFSDDDRADDSRAAQSRQRDNTD
jgi:hypothetical protein